MALDHLSRYIYGTTRLGDSGVPLAQRLAVARAAIKLGGWIHTSHQYGDALAVLRTVFDEDRAAVPPAIFKIGWSSVEEVRGNVVLQLTALGVPRMAIGQLCLGEPLAAEVAAGGRGLAVLKDEGLVERFVLEVFPWTSATALKVLENDAIADLIEGFIFYLNPLQRFASNELWDRLQERKTPIIAMRTVAGGDVHQIRDNPKAPDYLRQRAAQVAPIFEGSGVGSWTEFAARYSLGFGNVRATVGSTNRIANLNEFATATAGATPLPAEISEEIQGLQRQWADEHDRHAEPWSM